MFYCTYTITYYSHTHTDRVTVQHTEQSMEAFISSKLHLISHVSNSIHWFLLFLSLILSFLSHILSLISLSSLISCPCSILLLSFPVSALSFLSHILSLISFFSLIPCRSHAVLPLSFLVWCSVWQCCNCPRCSWVYLWTCCPEARLEQGSCAGFDMTCST